MSGALVTLVGWLSAAGFLALALAWHRRLGRRLELVARACHEVRGPLTAARLGVHLAGLRDGGDASRLAAVELELRRAGLAVDDLAAARHGRRVPDRRDLVDLGALLGEAAEAWRPVAEAHGARLELVAPVGAAGATVRGDRVRLAQACGNLLANAIEHGGGAIELRWRVAGSHARVEVCDGGPGLPAEFAALTHGPRTGRGARGRGLAIAADIAERHGGRLRSAPSSAGARVALELPAA